MLAFTFKVSIVFQSPIIKGINNVYNSNTDNSDNNLLGVSENSPARLVS